MRISDWSSDVCSSDLVVVRVRGLEAEANRIGVNVVVDKKVLPVVDRVVGVAVVRLAIRQEVEAVLRVGRQPRDVGRQVEIGRASCRERVCQYVSISVVSGTLKQKNETTQNNVP